MQRKTVDKLIENLNAVLIPRRIMLKYWEKGDKKRLYLSDKLLFETSKHRQIAYIDLSNLNLVVKIVPGDKLDERWIQSQNSQYLRERKSIERLAKIYYSQINCNNGK